MLWLLFTMNEVVKCCFYFIIIVKFIWCFHNKKKNGEISLCRICLFLFSIVAKGEKCTLKSSMLQYNHDCYYNEPHSTLTYQAGRLQLTQVVLTQSIEKGQSAQLINQVTQTIQNILVNCISLLQPTVSMFLAWGDSNKVGLSLLILFDYYQFSLLPWSVWSFTNRV